MRKCRVLAFSATCWRSGDNAFSFISAMMLRRFFTMMLFAALAGIAAISIQGRENDEQKSPDLEHSVRLLRPADAESLLIIEGVLTLWKGDVCLSTFPTFGWIKDVFWSPDSLYVAVNNRRANNGDYLWVFRLSDGHAIKKPVDAGSVAPEDPYDKYVARVQKWAAIKYPEIASAKVRRLFHMAQGWAGPSLLRVETTVTFQTQAKAVEILETYAVKANKLVLLAREARRLPW